MFNRFQAIGIHVIENNLRFRYYPLSAAPPSYLAKGDNTSKLPKPTPEKEELRWKS